MVSQRRATPQTVSPHKPDDGRGFLLTLSGLNFPLPTDAGDIDLLGEVAGVGTFLDVSRDAETITLYDYHVRVVSLVTLERAKRAAGRAKDLLDLAEITEIRKRGKGT